MNLVIMWIGIHINQSINLEQVVSYYWKKKSENKLKSLRDNHNIIKITLKRKR